ncbi:MAG: hypothetical protein ACXAEU_06835 [Candidatus Hodarchaeales archaeon]|jgi:pantetheine-phosphate adenylyltransferase
MVKHLSLEKQAVDSSRMFKSIIFGGTFDRLHSGHYLFLQVARVLASYSGVGLVTDDFLNGKSKKHSNLIRDYRSRQKKLLTIARNMGFVTDSGIPRIKMIPISRDFGLGDTMDADAILVSEETYPVILKMNESRQHNGLPPLKVVVVPYAVEMNGTRLSSSKLREFELKGES